MLKRLFRKFEAKHRASLNARGKSAFCLMSQTSSYALRMTRIPSLIFVSLAFAVMPWGLFNLGVLFFGNTPMENWSPSLLSYIVASAITLGAAITFAFKTSWDVNLRARGQKIAYNSHEDFQKIHSIASSPLLKGNPEVERTLVATARLADQLLVDFQDWLRTTAKDFPGLIVALEDSSSVEAAAFANSIHYSAWQEFQAQVEMIREVRSSLEGLHEDLSAEAAAQYAAQLADQELLRNSALPEATIEASAVLASELEGIKGLRLSSSTARKELKDYVEAKVLN